MNNEKQHSEYKIIETVATPTFDGISVETHPEDLLGGNTPEETRYIGWYIEGGGAQFFVGDIKGNYLVLLGNSLSLMNLFTTESYDGQTAPGQKTLEWFKNDASEVLGIQIENVEFNDLKVLKPDTEIVYSPHTIY